MVYNMTFSIFHPPLLAKTFSFNSKIYIMLSKTDLSGMTISSNYVEGLGTGLSSTIPDCYPLFYHKQSSVG